MKELFRYSRPLKIIVFFYVLFVLAQLSFRILFLHREWAEIDVSAATIAQSFAVGFVFDSVVSLYAITAILWIRIFVPKSWRHRKQDRILMAAVTASIVISSAIFLVSDYLFWDDIGARLNFLAVDYLNYPEEVIPFLATSYPMHLIIPGSGLVVLTVGILAYRYIVPVDPDPRSPRIRYAHATIATTLSCIAFFTVDISLSEISNNHYVNEVAKNGIVSLANAIRHYDRDYYNSFPIQSHEAVARRVREELSGPNVTFATSEPWDITRLIQPPGEEQRYNVIVVIMESMSAEYMRTFGNTHGLTDNLDRLASESLFYANHISAGMRTVRGVEAVTLSAPPTPGPSIVKRKHNDHLAAMGWAFRDRGYDTRFVYNGYARFDSMEGYAQGNGFDILDRHSISPYEVHFENSWGVCDEDMFMKVISEADASFARKQPFAYTVLTTSNHRPFTFPNGKITRPENVPDRLASAKYADYAIGRLIEEAKKRTWFDNTIFVFVADHAAISTGAREITLHKFHTPLIFYAPKIITPERSEKLCCQIDLSPTLLGLLNFTYYSRFYGLDLRNSTQERALLADYEKLGFFDGKYLTVLRPDGTARMYSKEGDFLGAPSPEELLNAVSYYQHGADWRRSQARVQTVVAPNPHEAKSNTAQ